MEFENKIALNGFDVTLIGDTKTEHFTDKAMGRNSSLRFFPGHLFTNADNGWRGKMCFL